MNPKTGNTSCICPTESVSLVYPEAICGCSMSSPRPAAVKAAGQYLAMAMLTPPPKDRASPLSGGRVSLPRMLTPTEMVKFERRGTKCVKLCCGEDFTTGEKFLGCILQHTCSKYDSSLASFGLGLLVFSDMAPTLPHDGPRLQSEPCDAPLWPHNDDPRFTNAHTSITPIWPQGGPTKPTTAH